MNTEVKSIAIKSQVRCLINHHLEELISGEAKACNSFPKPELFKKIPDTIKEVMLTFLLHPDVTAHIDKESFDDFKVIKKCNYMFIRGGSAGRYCEAPIANSKDGGDGLHCKQCMKKKSVSEQKSSRPVPVHPIEKGSHFIHEMKLPIPSDLMFIKIFDPREFNEIKDWESLTASRKENKLDDISADKNLSHRKCIAKMNELIYDYVNILMLKKGDIISFLEPISNETDSILNYIWDGKRCLPFGEEGVLPDTIPVNPDFGAFYFAKFLAKSKQTESILNLDGMEFKQIAKVQKHNFFECKSKDDKKFSRACEQRVSASWKACEQRASASWVYITRSKHPRLDAAMSFCSNLYLYGDERANLHYLNEHGKKKKVESDHKTYFEDPSFKKDLETIKELEASTENGNKLDHSKIESVYKKCYHQIHLMMELEIYKLIGSDDIGFNDDGGFAKVIAGTAAHTNLMYKLLKITRVILELCLKYGPDRVLIHGGQEFDTGLFNIIDVDKKDGKEKKDADSDADSDSDEDNSDEDDDNASLVIQHYDQKRNLVELRPGENGTYNKMTMGRIILANAFGAFFAVGTLNEETGIIERQFNPMATTFLNRRDIDIDFDRLIPEKEETKQVFKGETKLVVKDLLKEPIRKVESSDSEDSDHKIKTIAKKNTSFKEALVKKASDLKKSTKKAPTKKSFKKEESSDSENSYSDDEKKTPTKKVDKQDDSDDSDHKSKTVAKKKIPAKKVPAKKPTKKEKSSDSESDTPIKKKVPAKKPTKKEESSDSESSDHKGKAVAKKKIPAKKPSAAPKKK